MHIRQYLVIAWQFSIFIATFVLNINFMNVFQTEIEGVVISSLVFLLMIGDTSSNHTTKKNLMKK
jgi:hypothetical protein